MTLFRALVRVPALSGAAADSITNTWHFDIVGTPATEVANINTELTAFYTGLGTYRGDLHSWNSTEVRWYDMTDPKPRTPLFTSTLTTGTPASANNLPHELAICMSFKGQAISGVPVARTRGRLYLGPLSISALDATGRISSTAMAQVVTIGGNMRAASNSSLNWNWVVYSPTSGSTFTVQSGWVDHEFDVQRRRGFDPTSRSVF